MATYTITEALADLKTIGKRLEKKRAAVTPYLWRQDGLKDPLAKEEGGSAGFVARERQAIEDLEERVVHIRTAIQQVNLITPLTVQGEGHTIMEWLNWRKEISASQVAFIKTLRTEVLTIRKTAQSKGVAVVGPGVTPEKSQDILVNVDEAALVREAERLELVLGELDGKLSLLNATTMVTVPD